MPTLLNQSDFEDLELVKNALPAPAFEFLRKLAEDKHAIWREFIHFSDAILSEKQDFSLRLATARSVREAYAQKIEANFFDTETKDHEASIARLEARKAPLEARWKNLSTLHGHLINYVKDRDNRKRSFKKFDGPLPPSPKGVTWTSALDTIRTRIADLHQQLQAVRSAPFTCAEAKAMARQQITELAGRATVDATGAVLHGSKVKLPTITLPTIGHAGTGLQSPIAFDSEAMMAALFGPQLLQLIDAQIDQLADDKSALDAGTRNKKVLQLKTQLLESHRLEEKIILEIETLFPNSNPFRRPDADPRAVLQLSDDSPEPEEPI